jgi:hypothetical protein
VIAGENLDQVFEGLVRSYSAHEKNVGSTACPELSEENIIVFYVIEIFDTQKERKDTGSLGNESLLNELQAIILGIAYREIAFIQLTQQAPTLIAQRLIITIVGSEVLCRSDVMVDEYFPVA